MRVRSELGLNQYKLLAPFDSTSGQIVSNAGNEYHIEKPKVIDDATVENFFQIGRDEPYLLLAYFLTRHPGEWRASDVYHNSLRIQGISSNSSAEAVSLAEERGQYSAIKARCKSLPEDLFNIRTYKNGDRYFTTYEAKPESAEELSVFCLVLLYHSWTKLRKNGLSLIHLVGKHTRTTRTASQRWRMNRKIKKELIAPDGIPYEDKDCSLKEFREGDGTEFIEFLRQMDAIRALTLQESKFKVTKNLPKTDEDIEDTDMHSVGPNFLHKTFLALQILEQKYPEEYHSLQEISSMLGHLEDRFIKSDPIAQTNLEDRIIRALSRWKKKGYTSGTQSWAAVIYQYHRYFIIVDFDTLIDSYQKKEPTLIEEIANFRQKLEDPEEGSQIVIELLEAHARNSNYVRSTFFHAEDNEAHERIALSISARKQLEDAIIKTIGYSEITALELSKILQTAQHHINQALHSLEDKQRIVFVKRGEYFEWELSESEIEKQKRQEIDVKLTMAMSLLNGDGGIIHTRGRTSEKQITFETGELREKQQSERRIEIPLDVIVAWENSELLPITCVRYDDRIDQWIFFLPNALRQHHALAREKRVEVVEDVNEGLSALDTIINNIYQTAVTYRVANEFEEKFQKARQTISSARIREMPFRNNKPTSLS